MSDWNIFTGEGTPSGGLSRLPAPPSWRRFNRLADEEELAPLQDKQAIMMVNAALVLRRPLLVTGPPGSGKSTLAKLVARELGLGRVLRWPITTSSRLQDGLYDYDAIGRVHDANYGNGRQRAADFDIGRYIRLGPLGTALLPSDRPRVLLIDEIDKSDIDLPSNLLHVFEEGEFTIKELERLHAPRPGNPGTSEPGDNNAGSGEARTNDSGTDDPGIKVRTDDNTWETVHNGIVRCQQFPFVLLTSNGERTFPAPFLRRCLRLELKQPQGEYLQEILDARIHGGPDGGEPADGSDGAGPVDVSDLKERFKAAVEANQQVASDQLLNAVFVAFSFRFRDPETRQSVMDSLLEPLG